MGPWAGRHRSRGWPSARNSPSDRCFASSLDPPAATRGQPAPPGSSCTASAIDAGVRRRLAPPSCPRCGAAARGDPAAADPAPARARLPGDDRPPTCKASPLRRSSRPSTRGEHHDARQRRTGLVGDLRERTDGLPQPTATQGASHDAATALREGPGRYRSAWVQWRGSVAPGRPVRQQAVALVAVLLPDSLAKWRGWRRVATTGEQGTRAGVAVRRRPAGRGRACRAAEAIEQRACRALDWGSDQGQESRYRFD
jgi:hypothetical protein